MQKTFLVHAYKLMDFVVWGCAFHDCFEIGVFYGLGLYIMVQELYYSIGIV